MKKIETKEQKQKRKRLNQIFIGGVMILLLVLSTAGFALLNKDDDSTNQQINQKEVNGFNFIKQDNMWITEINEKTHVFFFLPEELNEIEINITKTVLDYINRPLYVMHNANQIQQIQYNLYPEYLLRINSACIENEECEEENIPVKNCSSDNIIIFKSEENNITKVYQKENCIYIEGDLTKGTDKFLYKILGVI